LHPLYCYIVRFSGLHVVSSVELSYCHFHLSHVLLLKLHLALHIVWFPLIPQHTDHDCGGFPQPRMLTPASPAIPVISSSPALLHLSIPSNFLLGPKRFISEYLDFIVFH
jgi:hypothetical protein